MAVLKNRTGANLPLWVEDITYYFDLTTDDFSPLEDAPEAFTDSREELYIKNGFAVCNATEDAGVVLVITLWQYQHNHYDLATLVPVPVFLMPGDWVMTPVVKVFQSEGQDLVYALVETINVGIIR